MFVLARSRLFRKYAASLVAVVAVALVVSGVLNILLSYREQKHLLVLIQREQAASAATQIRDFVRGIEHQIGWLTQIARPAGAQEELHIDAVRLLRQEPAIMELTQLDDAGREQLRVSRTARDVVASGADRSDLIAYREARAKGVYFGPVYFVEGSEPHMQLAVAGARRDAGVSIAEINLKLIWDLVSGIKVGTHGRAYVVDAGGRLLAHPDLRQVLRGADLSQSPQVRAALASAGHAEGVEAKDIDGRVALAVSAPVVPLGWQVLIERPLEDAYAPVYASMAVSAALLVGALGFAVLAGLLLSRRLVVPIRALTEGAARIGSGDFGQRLSIRTGDELEALGSQFNRMAGHLQESYTLLESKVEARTAELARARDQAVVEHAEAERARRTAEVANETKSRFLAVVSHEIRTPINGIMGVFQLLDRSRLAAGQRRLLDQASVAGETLMGLIDAILDYAKLEAKAETLEPRDFDLPNLIEATVGLMRPQAEAKGLSLDLALDLGGTGRVHGDPVRLNRVLLNLLGNAIKFTDDGNIRVVATLAAAPGGSSLEVTVQDTGIGIPPEMRERIFEEFVQADDSIVRRFGGAGLGLAISRRLARLMGGDLTVESDTGRGSSFRLAVPLARASETGETQPMLSASRPLKVLIVDDEAMNRDVAAALVQRQGHQATVAADPLAALEAARAGDLDVVLMDLHMPGMTGIEVAAQLRALPLRRQPIIMALTADATEESRVRLDQAGIGTVLRKPLLDDALRAALASVEGVSPTAPALMPVTTTVITQGTTQGLAQGLAHGLAQGLAPASAFDQEAVVDEAFLRQQAALLGSARLAQLETLFRDTTGELIAAIEQAREPLDRAAIARSAHRLVGAAAVLGLGRLFASANAIEADAAQAPTAQLEAAIAALVATHRDSLAALAARGVTVE